MFAVRSATRLNVLIWTGCAATIALAIRALYLSARYLAGALAVPRFQVESAVLMLAVVGLGVRLVTNDAGTSEAVAPRPFPRSTWAMWCVAALVLYWPALRIGLLSDDFVLADRALRGAYGFANPELLRPIPLLLWTVVLRCGAGAVGLHVLNVLAHGTVAFLTTRLVAPMSSSRTTVLLAGLVVLAFPLSPEAVAWCSGIFDVAATALCIGAVLIGRRYTSRTTTLNRIALVTCSILALLCKETAAIVPLLILLDAWALRRLSRQLVNDSGLLIGSFGVVAVVRLAWASSVMKRPITKYVVQRWVFGTIGGLVVPWHVEVVRTLRWMTILTAEGVLLLAVLFFLTKGSIDQTKQALTAFMWTLVGTLPVVTVLFVSPDLQGSRYLYLPSIGYAVCLSVLLSHGHRRAMRLIGTSILVMMVSFFTVGVRIHLDSWRAAAARRDAVQLAAKTDSRLQACRAVALDGLPDNVRGAYVLRNGGQFAVAEVGLTMTPTAPPACSFRWDDVRVAFVPNWHPAN